MHAVHGVLGVLGVLGMLCMPAPAAAHSVYRLPQKVVDPVAIRAAYGVAGERGWLVGVQGGYPWSGLRAQLGLRGGLSPLVELQSARLRRFRPAVGVSRLWYAGRRLRIGSEALVGWLFQVGDLARRGPNLELRLRLAVRVRLRFTPYLMIGSQHTLLADRTTIEAAEGTTRTWSLRGEWTGFATLGVLIAATPNLGLDFGLDAAWVDAAAGTPAIPGAHAGLVFGGLR